MHPLSEQRIWDWALGMATHVSTLSKDPSTKVGAVIFDYKRRLISAGYNGLPRGVMDTQARLHDRDVKLKMTLHAEVNAIGFATGPLSGATLICTHPCCTQCTAMIIQSGIAHVCWPKPDKEFLARWEDDFNLARQMFQEAEVHIDER